MCIRDRDNTRKLPPYVPTTFIKKRWNDLVFNDKGIDRRYCLLYTSDAADERSSVDLGGRRIIKKKKQETLCVWATDITQRR